MNESSFEYKALASIAFLVVALLLRWASVKFLPKIPTGESDINRRWINLARNITTTAIVVGLIVIWLSELRFAALSIATFTVALIIATREFIQCFLGAVYQASSRIFSIGDWIKVNHQYGEVVSSDWMTTKLLEVDIESGSYGYTGRTLIIPNNLFVTGTIQNLNYMRRYVNHTFSIIRDAENVNLIPIKSFIKHRAHEYCQPFEEVAKRYNSMLETRMGVTLSGPDVSVSVSTTDLGKNKFKITIFCPTPEAAIIEEKLTDEVLDYWYKELEKSNNRDTFDS
ncbi:mechanosensitive ion channel protein MscS [Bacterioplanes sanyensis]|uniref:Mechanosensitive ion channel protein MscS n=1 Tax=Bacterioplanes sanyensis TaxID=1249553 RepID=A0A222FFZ2_9GAMM|nr:mechanosensitive ion channel family protein [Bacterioplanes sanyensis]ASP37552.1 mechanosensitive ion channel protein MscS [Bacterioplanes sanyensis]